MQDRPNQTAATDRTGRRRRAGASAVRPLSLESGAIEALRDGVAADGVAVALCDADDVLLYANPTFRASFCPSFDGRPAAFLSVMEAAIRTATGIRLTTADPAAFYARIAARRRSQTGSFSFSTDTADGRWWWMTDTKLPSGWMMIVGQDISSLKHQEFALRDAHASALEEAQTDDLTGAPNRRHGFRRGEAAVAAARIDGLGLTAALMDIDHFKAINDRHGHDAGDAALCHFARVLAGAVGPDEQFCRLGGDEFLMLSRRSGAVDMERCLGKIFRTMPPVVVPGARKGLRLSISTGIATLAAGEDWADLLRRADRALYAAKAGGRDRIERAA